MSRDEAAEPQGFPSGNGRLKEDLLSLGAELDSLVAFADGRQDPTPTGPGRWLYELFSGAPGPRAREVLRRWRELFADELEIVRLARNTVAHAMYISDDNLRKAVAVAEQLVRIARSSVGADADQAGRSAAV